MSAPGSSAMPPTWSRVAELAPLVTRYRGTDVAGLDLLAFGDEFDSSLSLEGDTFLDLQHLAMRRLYDPPVTAEEEHRAAAFDALMAGLPGVFHVVVSSRYPRRVWLALHTARLDDTVADALIALR